MNAQMRASSDLSIVKTSAAQMQAENTARNMVRNIS